MTMISFTPIVPKRPIIGTKAQITAMFGTAMKDTVSEGQRFIATYPTQVLRKTGYRRTSTLKRSWSSEIHSGGDRIEGIVGSSSNIAPYNEYVQGKKGKQVKIFERARWSNVDDLVAKMNKGLVRRIEAGIERLAGR